MQLDKHPDIDLLKRIVSGIVSTPSQVRIVPVPSSARKRVYQIHVAFHDHGKVVGKGANFIMALQSLFKNYIGPKHGEQLWVVIDENHSRESLQTPKFLTENWTDEKDDQIQQLLRDVLARACPFEFTVTVDSLLSKHTTLRVTTSGELPEEFWDSIRTIFRAYGKSNGRLIDLQHDH